MEAVEARVDGMVYTITQDDGTVLTVELDPSNPKPFLDQMEKLGLGIAYFRRNPSLEQVAADLLNGHA
jgi:hypothetical protein